MGGSPDYEKLTAQALHNIREKLLDLTLRNKLLNYRECAKSIRVVDELPDRIFTRLVDDGDELEFIAIPENSEKAGGIDQSRELPAPPGVDGEMEEKHRDKYLQTLLPQEKLEVRLRHASLEAQRALQETGANLLYLTMGLLEWTDKKSGKDCRAPLIMIPVELQRRRVKIRKRIAYRYVLRYKEEDMTSNYCLARKLAEDYGVIIPELPEDPEEIQPETYFDAVAEAIEDVDNWRVAREMILDFYSFAKLFMYLDLDPTTWPEEVSPAKHLVLMDLLVGREPPKLDVNVDVYDIDRDERAAQLDLVYEADSAQQSAMIDAVDGMNMVIEGPPGTGKSQTISNLIATALGQGKTILFLAEKMAALNVVKQRLDRVGLGPFVLEVHSHKTDKRTLVNSLRERMEHRQKRKVQFDYNPAERNRLRDELNAYRDLLNTPFGESGLSPHAIVWQMERTRLPDMVRAPAHLDAAKAWSPAEFDVRCALAKEIQGLLDGVAPAASCWFGFRPVNITAANDDDLPRDLAALRDATLDFDAAFDAVDQLVGAPSERSLPIAAGITKLGSAHLLNIPELNQDLISRLADKSRFRMAQDLVGLFDKIHDLRAQSGEVLSDLSTLSDDEFRSIAKRLRTAVDDRLLELRHGELVEVASRLRRIKRLLENLREALAGIDSLPIHIPQTGNNLSKLRKFLRFVGEETPPEAELYACEQLFQPSVGKLVKRAKKELAGIVKLRTKVEKVFDLKHAPNPERIQELIDTFTEHSGLFALFSSDYRDAIRAIGTFMIKRPNDAQQRLQLLRLLRDYVQLMTNFCERDDYRVGLGDLFAGEHTDWEQLERMIEWAVELRKILPGEAVLDSFRYTFKTSYQAICKLYTATEAYFSEMQENRKALTEMLGEEIGPRYRFDLAAGAPLFGAAKRIDEALVEIAELRKVLDERVIDPQSLLKGCIIALEQEEEARAILSNIHAQAPGFADAVGELFDEADTDYAALAANVGWVRSLRDAGVGSNELAWLCAENTLLRGRELASRYAGIATAWRTFTETAAQLNAYGRFDAEAFGRGANGPLPLEELRQKAEQGLSSMATIHDWADYSRACEEADSLGMTPFIQDIESGRIAPESCGQAFAFAYYSSLLRSALDELPELGEQSQERMRVRSDRFRELEHNSLAFNADSIIRRLKKNRPPQGVAHGPTSERTEMGLIRREISKSKRHVPIRALIERAGKAITRLKPCFMMSPLSVAQYLPPGEIEFDLLIMDEASQLRPEECLGAIARSKQIVVVGDPKQLPPTSFFDRVTDEAPIEEEETALDNLESILDLFTQSYGGGRRLLWHYRSRHQDLIRFSNHHFYGDSLTVFPSPHHAAEGYGVKVEYVEDGRYEAGRNPVEAMAVARAVVAHAQEREGVSLGVGTFNSAQREEILHSIDAVLNENPEAIPAFERLSSGHEHFFVKNLENIQGDERDVIFVSYTYGPAPKTGKVYQRFGPINNREGWRRLNVMFTRSRCQMRIFSSMQPDMIRLGRDTGRGAQMLRAYLEYASGKQHLLRSGEVTQEKATPLQAAVGQVVEELGVKADMNVGSGGCRLDLAIRDPKRPGEYGLGILGDGPIEAAFSCNDRECLRTYVLELLGWNLHPISSVDWFKRREREMQRLRQRLEAEVETK